MVVILSYHVTGPLESGHSGAVIELVINFGASMLLITLSLHTEPSPQGPFPSNLLL